jgi:hypothetical protein
LLADVRQCRAVDALGAEDIDVEQPGEFLRRERLAVAGVQVASVVHDDVQPPGLAGHGGDCGIGGVLRLDVELDGPKVDALPEA